MQTVFDYYCNMVNSEVNIQWTISRINAIGMREPKYKPSRFNCLYDANFICNFSSQCPYEREFHNLVIQWMEENN